MARDFLFCLTKLQSSATSFDEFYRLSRNPTYGHGT